MIVFYVHSLVPKSFISTLLPQDNETTVSSHTLSCSKRSVAPQCCQDKCQTLVWSPQKDFAVLPPNRLWPTSYPRTLDAHSTLPCLGLNCPRASVSCFFLYQTITCLGILSQNPSGDVSTLPSSTWWTAICPVCLPAPNSNLLKDRDHAGGLLCVELTWRWGPHNT